MARNAGRFYFSGARPRGIEARRRAGYLRGSAAACGTTAAKREIGMASVFSHPAVPLALAVAAGPRLAPPALVTAACAASVLPDIDALGFFAGVPYGHP